MIGCVWGVWHWFRGFWILSGVPKHSGSKSLSEELCMQATGQGLPKGIKWHSETYTWSLYVCRRPIHRLILHTNKWLAWHIGYEFMLIYVAEVQLPVWWDVMGDMTPALIDWCYASLTWTFQVHCCVSCLPLETCYGHIRNVVTTSPFFKTLTNKCTIAPVRNCYDI